MSSLWQEVWNAHDPERIGDFVTEDFVLTDPGGSVEGREVFTAWVAAFLGQVQDLRLEVVGSFQNEDGSRVASRWVAHGRSNGLLGTEPDGRPVRFSGTAVWAVREDGGLRHAWVERSAWELTRQLTGTAGR
ncbi:ester cyclase [Actinacidiphila glaucinigra]|uniref:ester cyclase n=1 Tax=Actinacidiphila glaucinigra TaxID=235986 RepID=UPI0035D72CC9